MHHPRPILKRNLAPYPAHIDTSLATLAPKSSLSPHEASSSRSVHFPSSPTLTRTFDAHSAAAYDRSPIVVSRNSCALPERGCPGRTYALDDDDYDSGSSSRAVARRRDERREKDIQPSAGDDSIPFSDGRSFSSSLSDIPALIPDLSESEDSDSSSGHGPYTRHDSLALSPPMSISTKPPTYALYPSSSNLSFLPHPHHHKDSERPRGRSRERDRGRSRSRTRPGTPTIPEEEEIHLPPSSASRAVAFASLPGTDQGCLAGF